MSALPAGLCAGLIHEMAAEFMTRWSGHDRRMATIERAVATLERAVWDPRVVFQVQHDQQGRLVSTSMLVDRDCPAFDDTGPGGADRYGAHWVANVFTSPAHRGRGHARSQIESLQKTSRRRGWRYVWLYCREREDGMNLPAYYRDRLQFRKFGEEIVDDNGTMEKVSIMRFDTEID